MSHKKVRVLINVPEDVLDRITAYAEVLGLSRSRFILDCVEETMMDGRTPDSRRLVDPKDKERLREIVQGFVSDCMRREILAELAEPDQGPISKRRTVKKGRK